MIEANAIGLATAFAAGAVSFLSPCVLPLVPGYVSYVAGRTLQDEAGVGTARTLGLSLCFVLGFSTVFVLLGAGASVLGRSLAAYQYEATLLGGAIVILFGAVTAGIIRIPWLERELKFHADAGVGGPGGAYLLGLAFAFGWTPCIGPVLGAILAVTASSASSLSGVALLAVYSLGLGVPFVLAALFLQAFSLRMKAMRRMGRALRIGAGGVMIMMGIAMITGRLTDVAIWFLETFPALGLIG